MLTELVKLLRYPSLFQFLLFFPFKWTASKFSSYLICREDKWSSTLLCWPAGTTMVLLVLQKQKPQQFPLPFRRYNEISIVYCRLLKCLFQDYWLALWRPIWWLVIFASVFRKRNQTCNRWSTYFSMRYQVLSFQVCMLIVFY